jgi:hypothetical protein
MLKVEYMTIFINLFLKIILAVDKDAIKMSYYENNGEISTNTPISNELSIQVDMNVYEMIQNFESIYSIIKLNKLGSKSKRGTTSRIFGNYDS